MAAPSLHYRTNLYISICLLVAGELFGSTSAFVPAQTDSLPITCSSHPSRPTVSFLTTSSLYSGAPDADHAAQNDDDPSLQITQKVESLLDDTVLLYGRPYCPVWVQDQLTSLARFLGRRLHREVTSDNSSVEDEQISPLEIAQAIDQAILGRASPQEIESLIQKFRRRSGGDSSNIDDELEAVGRQLDAFGKLIDQVTPPAPAESQALLSPEARTIKTTNHGGSSVASSSTPPPSSAGKPFLQPRTTMRPPKNSSRTALHALGDDNQEGDRVVDDAVDVAIIGSGIGGLCAGAILNTLYGKKVAIYESHYHAGGCAHAFERRASNGVTFTFDSGPTILLGCSSPPFNALQQVLAAVGQKVDWIPYKSWGVIERPGDKAETRWKLELGPTEFEEPLQRFGGDAAVREFRELRKATKGLRAGAQIPALAMRSGASNLIPLLRYFPTLVSLIQEGEKVTGTFAPFMDGPLFQVTNPFLRNWLDALAFSLSGLPASRTAAAAMAFVLYDMHRPGATLDYPTGGMGEIVDALVRGVEQGENGSKVNLRAHVDAINFSDDGRRATGLSLRNDKRIIARDGVICNAPVWSLANLIKDDIIRRKLSPPVPSPGSSWTVSDEGSSINLTRKPVEKGSEDVLFKCSTAEMTGSFLHLHLAIDAEGLDLDSMEPHYTVMDRGLAGDETTVNGVKDGPCGELNMIAVSNLCVIDRTLAPEGYIIVHAYGAANEPYEIWNGLDRTSEEYKALKEERAEVLWRAVESIIPDVRQKAVLSLIGSPLTHEMFLRRPRGTYGSSTEDYLKDGSTPFDSLWLASDGVFPGIGLPSVAIAGASAANSVVPVLDQCLMNWIRL